MMSIMGLRWGPGYVCRRSCDYRHQIQGLLNDTLRAWSLDDEVDCGLLDWFVEIVWPGAATSPVLMGARLKRHHDQIWGGIRNLRVATGSGISTSSVEAAVEFQQVCKSLTWGAMSFMILHKEARRCERLPMFRFMSIPWSAEPA